MPDYGAHRAEEIIEAYEAAVARLRNGYPLQAALIEVYVQDVLDLTRAATGPFPPIPDDQRAREAAGVYDPVYRELTDDEVAAEELTWD